MAVYDPCATYTSLQTALRNSKPIVHSPIFTPSNLLPPPTLQPLPITNTSSNVFEWRRPNKTSGTIAWTNCVRQSITRLDACKISSVRMAIGSQKYLDKDSSDDEQSNLSAFLGPNLWEKSYGTDFKLEYMDLDEFLVENGIPTDPAMDEAIDTDSVASLEVKPTYALSTPSSPEDDKTLVFSDNESMHGALASVDDMNNDSKDESESFCPEDDDDDDEEQDYEYDNESKKPGYKVPGAKGFDPTKRKFTTDELKPQPLIKKSRKIFVPDDHKDDKYWARRKKNNVAAKRSRDARRVKENQIALRANFLESENNEMKAKLEKALKDLAIIKTEKETLSAENLYLQKQLAKKMSL